MDTPERLFSIVKELRSRSDDPVQVYWHTVPAGRDAFHRDLLKLVAHEPILPVVLRGDGFTNPNAILSDLNRLIEQHRDEFMHQRFANAQESMPVLLILLSRVEFLVPQLSSPTVLPSWFPCVGGQTCTVLIRDLAKSGDGLMSAPEAHIADLCSAIYEFDAAVCRRLRRMHEADKRNTAALHSVLFPTDPKPERFVQFLDDAEGFLSGVRNPEGYRPSHKDGGCVAARLMGLFFKATPDELTKQADKLKTSLGLVALPADAPPEPMCAVLFRPTNPDKDAGRRLARAMIVVVYAACQFVTAAAHADNYPRYPLSLLRAQSYDLRSSLVAFARVLNLLQ